MKIVHKKQRGKNGVAIVDPRVDGAEALMLHVRDEHPPALRSGDLWVVEASDGHRYLSVGRIHAHGKVTISLPEMTKRMPIDIVTRCIINITEKE
jgi:hypothetical protein